LYSDNEVGAACATGDGDDIMKYCPSYRVVQLMSSDPNLSPADVCTRVIQDIRDHRSRHKLDMFEIGLIAMNMKVLEISHHHRRYNIIKIVIVIVIVIKI